MRGGGGVYPSGVFEQYPRRFQLHTNEDWLPTVFGLVVFTAGASMGAAYAVPDSGYPFWATAAVFAVIIGGFPAFVIAAAAVDHLSRPAFYPPFVELRTEGVRIGRRLIPYTDIGSVEHKRQSRVLKVPVWDHVYRDEARYEWTVSISLRGSDEIVTFRTNLNATYPDDGLGAELVEALRASLPAPT